MAKLLSKQEFDELSKKGLTAAELLLYIEERFVQLSRRNRAESNRRDAGGWEITRGGRIYLNRTRPFDDKNVRRSSGVYEDDPDREINLKKAWAEFRTAERQELSAWWKSNRLNLTAKNRDRTIRYIMKNHPDIIKAYHAGHS